ncbi:TetR/AcrR family transcriptional regulator [Pseudonocardia eucalypti]|uniref:TetR/AcrR family transcriptional regulator n=1 Tax=Pseudonocardia eucalypti TaxID=648755 RepID=A0ABP9QD24_9PSEU|nr:AcrR family transcriptional regulator [Pseudonocardia eucalypti]
MTTPKRLRPRNQPKQPRARQTREDILRAAAQVFAQHGYAAGTTNRITEAAYLSIGALYQYFPNKDAILLELMNAHVDAGVDAVRKHLAGGLPDRLEDTLALFVRAAVDNHRDQPRLHQVLFEEAPRPARFLARLHVLEAELVAGAGAFLAGHPEVRVTDTHVAARMVVGTIESLVHRFFAVAEPPTEVDRFERELVAMLGRYLRG